MTLLLFSCVGENKSGPHWYFTPTCPAIKNNVGAPLWVNGSIPTFTIAHNLQDRQRAKHFLSLASVKVRLSLKQFLQGGSCSSEWGSIDITEILHKYNHMRHLFKCFFTECFFVSLFELVAFLYCQLVILVVILFLMYTYLKVWGQ